MLSDKHVTVFGAGAIGSNLAYRLAEAGLGKLTVVDGDRLRPGNIVRHAVGAWAIGSKKALAIGIDLQRRAPWTKIEPVHESPWNPDRISEHSEHSDCVVDATGLATFTTQLALLFAPKGPPLVSVALYRAGAVARVRRQALLSDTPIVGREADVDRYVAIPAADEPFVYEPGCSAPVNNASPIAVAHTAALTAEVLTDLLVGRALYGDEVLEVFRSLETPPFDRIGTLRL